jgi:hypothetical protein
MDPRGSQIRANKVSGQENGIKLVTIEGHTERPTYSLLIRHGPHRKRRDQQFYRYL